MDGNGSVTTWQYDARHRETLREHADLTVRSTWDGNGNRLSCQIDDAEGSRIETAEYDAFNRAEREVDGYGNERRHTYDGNGNRIRSDAPAPSGGVQATLYQWDILDRLTEIRSGARLMTMGPSPCWWERARGWVRPSGRRR